MLKLIKYELKVLIRTKIYYIIIIPLLYFLYFSIYDGVHNLTLSAYVIQLLILGSMVIGFQASISEYQNNYRDILQITNQRDHIITARLIASYIYIFCINLLLILTLIFFCILQKIPLWICFEAILFMSLYYVLGSIIAITIGHIIGVVIHSKVAYFYILLISVSIGPTGKEFVELLFTLFNLDLGFTRTAANFINIAPFAPDVGFNYLYGFEIESKRWFFVFLYLIILITIYFIINGIREKKKKKIFVVKVTCGMMIAIFLILLYSQDIFIRKTGYMTDDAEALYDYTYYRDKEIDYEEENYQLLSVNAAIDTRKCLAVSGDFKIHISKKTNSITATLYRDLKINEVQCQDQDLRFEQKGDNVIIYFERELQENEELTLHLEYKGITSQYFYAGEKASYLPSYYSWLPYPAVTTSMYLDASFVGTMPLYLKNGVNFDIEFEGYHDVYSNLKVDGNHITGTSNEGLTIISGHVNEYSEDGITYYFTDNLRRDSAVTYAKNLNNSIEEVEKTLDMQSEKIERVFLVPTKSERVGSHIIDSVKAGSTIYTGTYYADDTKEWYYDEALGSVMSSDLGFVMQSKEIRKLFINLFEKWYFKQNGLVEEIQHKPDKEYEMFYEFVDNSESEKVTSFFTQWYKEMQTKSLTMDDLTQILNSLN